MLARFLYTCCLWILPDPPILWISHLLQIMRLTFATRLLLLLLPVKCVLQDLKINHTAGWCAHIDHERSQDSGAYIYSDVQIKINCQGLIRCRLPSMPSWRHQVMRSLKDPPLEYSTLYLFLGRRRKRICGSCWLESRSDMSDLWWLMLMVSDDHPI